ncbi:MAG: hypothetical protein J6582_00145 [Snodgrassella sp.]|uniref:hypothetical protein n=1 Tax=Snodgrassella sp. TaxID=2815304 RepID=UPI002589831F|nr:hypothetical protein [Snodgrassella sp.]MCO6519439.1 hypothetical protein [Snodgrassella sp.]
MKCFKGYYINGVVVKDNGFICFLAKEIRDDLDPVLDEELYKKRSVVYHHNEHGDEQWGNVTRSGRVGYVYCHDNTPIESS